MTPLIWLLVIWGTGVHWKQRRGCHGEEERNSDTSEQRKKLLKRGVLQNSSLYPTPTPPAHTHPIRGWDILGREWRVSSWGWCVGSRSSSKHKDLSNFDKNQMFKAAGLPVVPGMQWLLPPKSGPRNWQQVPKSHMWGTHLVWSH